MSDLRTLVRGIYNIQKLRIQMGNRLVGNFKVKLGQAPSEPESTLDKKGETLLKQLRADYKKITDGIQALPTFKKFKSHGVIDTYTELCLVSSYDNLEKEEKAQFKYLDNALKEHEIFTQYLKKVKGIGPAMAGVILSEIDITKAKYPSSLWKYAGLDVAANGAGRSRKKEHLVDTDYIDKDGKKATKKGITFNPFLKTKLTGVLAGSFLKAGDNPYKEAYYNYKDRLENHPDHKNKTKGHRHNMANRYIVKLFLVDLHREWRTIAGLPVSIPYSEAKLGMKHAS
ncbi:uncharacterized protein METZ01_LOCUS230892 [marine metagenome]|uniref:Transposase IS116/IS110/IS902 C-terminal domain-containing protein n=1 Tax=marine metagenome TaxID=408172 RepID=A0A382GSF6_9ZZZZ